MHWYMPYGQSIFGSFTTGQPERGQLSRNILSTGDPRKERTVQDIVVVLVCEWNLALMLIKEAPIELTTFIMSTNKLGLSVQSTWKSTGYFFFSTL